MFQSSPAPESRCNTRRRAGRGAASKFQSSPAPESRCNNISNEARETATMFQSSPAPESRCNHRRNALVRGENNVSILTGSGEPVQSGNLRRQPPMTEFQSSPAPESRCNPRRNRHRQKHRPVSILTGSGEPVQWSVYEEIGTRRASGLTGVEMRRCRFPRGTRREPCV